jgi:outer membrane protein insertion porin family
MSIRFLHNIWMIVLLLSFFSCSIKKYIPEGEHLYTAHKLTLETSINKQDRSRLESELTPLIRPNPNSSILGQRFGLWAYYKGQQEKPGFINRYLARKFGEEPVYLSSVQPQRTEGILLNRLENKGYFLGSSTSEISKGRKYAQVSYRLLFGEAYKLATYILQEDTSVLMKTIQEDLENTLLPVGSRFDLDQLKAERTRIDAMLKSKGYFNFNADLLIFEVDTNQYQDKRFDLLLRLKSNVPPRALHPYTIQNISVFPDFSISGNRQGGDTVVVNGVGIIQDELVFKPEYLEPYILFKNNTRFNPTTSRLTSNRLSAIGNFRYVNIEFQQADTVLMENGTYPLNARVFLSPLNKRSVRAELQGVTKSNTFVGPGLVLNYSNRNIFQAGEIFTLRGNIGYEQQVASGQREALRSLELGLQANLIFPRVLFPVPIMNRFQIAIPKTRMGLGFEYQNRTDLYLIQSYNASFGYFWNVNRYAYHELNPLALSVVNLARTTPQFEEILNSNPFLRRSFEQQFILGLNYAFNYNQLVDDHRKTPLFFASSIDVAGNSLFAVNSIFNARKPESFLGLEYAQYIKGDVDFRIYHRFTRENLLIARFFGGLGAPLGNSVSLPFVKQYFSGGPRSVRSFRIRSLGPGSFVPQTIGTGGFFDQAGDIIIESNLEYRFPFNKYLKGAVFADAGNVWLFNENEALPGGKFSSKWAEQLGVGAGIGLRFDIQIFVLRFDLATPLRRPWMQQEERWLRDLKLNDRDWRRDNLILNFAIGYPF